MNVAQSFEKAHSYSVHTALNLPVRSNQDYLAVTALDLTSPFEVMKAQKTSVFVQSLSNTCEANETLNSLALWMMEMKAFDQNAVHGHDRPAYSIGFYHLRSDQSYASLVNEFYLGDFTFPDRRAEDAPNLDEFMRMLDRDRLAEAMRRSLVDEFSLPLREDAPLYWRRDLRFCCHPDHQGSVDAILQGKNPYSGPVSPALAA